MKAWRCSEIDKDYAASTCHPKECGMYEGGVCGSRPVIGKDGFATDDPHLPCDAEPVRIIPEADHAAQQAALAGAEAKLRGAIEWREAASGTGITAAQMEQQLKKFIEEALAQIRAAQEEK